MTSDEILMDAEERMEKAVNVFKDELRGLRTGRATPALVDTLRVEYYGSPTPLKQLAQISTDFVGREYGRKAETATSFPAAEAFLWSQASVSVGGAGHALFESLTVRLNNNLQAYPALDGRLRPNFIKRSGFRTVDVNGTITFATNSDYDLFINGSETALRVTFTGPAISASPANNAIFDIQVPAFRYTAFPININGPGRISIPFQGRGMWHSGSGTALEMTIVNTRTSAYIS